MKTFRNILTTSVVAFSVVHFCGTKTNNQGVDINTLKEPVITETEDHIKTEVSDKVIKENYEKAAEVMEETNSREKLTLEQFTEGYNTHNFDIEKYTELTIENFKDRASERTTQDLIMNSSSSGDEKYVLNTDAKETGTNPYTYSYDFKRAPIYSGYNGKTFDYSCLKVGDIILETNTPSDLYAGHTALVLSVNHRGYYGSYVQTIEAIGSGVKYGFLDDKRMVDFKVRILRVRNASDYQMRQAALWHESQFGKPYNININRLQKSADSPSWYCSELVYASYYAQGIDIGAFIDGLGNVKTMTLGCLPWDIYKSYNTFQKGIVGKYYPDFILLRNSNYNFYVCNYTGEARYIYYNKKMCFENDAKKWKGLKDVKSVYVYNDSKSGGVISISPNWFATDVVFSVVVGNTRYITYAHNLNSAYMVTGFEPKECDIFYSTVSA